MASRAPYLNCVRSVIEVRAGGERRKGRGKGKEEQERRVGGRPNVNLKKKLFRSTENWVPDGVIPHLAGGRGGPVLRLL